MSFMKKKIQKYLKNVTRPSNFTFGERPNRILMLSATGGGGSDKSDEW